MAMLRRTQDDPGNFNEESLFQQRKPQQPEAPQAPQLGSFGVPGDEGVPSRSGESPREREAPAGPFAPYSVPGRIPDGDERGAPGGEATPTQPMTPSPVAGVPPVKISHPMPGPNPQAMTSTLRGKGGYFGGQGGLTGGGFGLPFDPTSNAASDPITTLLQKLLGGGGGF
jgi:hypothetical protein